MGDTFETANTTPQGNTKRSSMSRLWCITINNYTENDIKLMDDLKNHPNIKECNYQFETGDNETPHIQGYAYFKSERTFKELKNLLPRAHIEKAKGSLKSNRDYCSKTKTRINPLDIEYNKYMEETYNMVEWKPFQQDILNIIESKPSDRKVHWFYEEKGNSGKSYLCKYLDWKYDAIICNGKQTDIFNQYKAYLDEKQKYPKVVICDIPRSHKEYVCYSTFEKIKDGLFYSGKYEGGKLRLIPHHLIIFSNFEPNTDKLSLDRWDIHEITP